jgi:hypothetical protein
MDAEDPGRSCDAAAMADDGTGDDIWANTKPESGSGPPPPDPDAPAPMPPPDPGATTVQPSSGGSGPTPADPTTVQPTTV